MRQAKLYVWYQTCSVKKYSIFCLSLTQLSFIKEHEGSLQMENDRLREKLSRQDTSSDRDDDIK